MKQITRAYFLDDLISQIRFQTPDDDVLFKSGLFDHIPDDIKQELSENLDKEELNELILLPDYFNGESFLNTNACKEIRELLKDIVDELTNDVDFEILKIMALSFEYMSLENILKDDIFIQERENLSKAVDKFMDICSTMGNPDTPYIQFDANENKYNTGLKLSRELVEATLESEIMYFCRRMTKATRSNKVMTIIFDYDNEPAFLTDYTRYPCIRTNGILSLVPEYGIDLT